MDVTVSGIITDVKPMQPSNAPFPMDATPEFILTVLMDEL
jgi:hypothetical protein